MADLIDTTEMYLRTVFELEEEGTTPLRARIAERLEQSGPTVSQTVSRMERDGLLHVGEDRVIRLSATGRHLAARVMRKHRVAECMLVDLLNLDPASVHAEACRWEHVISDDVELRVLRILGNPTHSPFGNPIPALASLDPSLVEADESVSLVRLADAGDAGTTRLVRIDERAQEDANLLARMSGFQPGDTIDHRRQAGDYLIAAGHGSVTITAAEAQHLWVHPETED